MSSNNLINMLLRERKSASWGEVKMLKFILSCLLGLFRVFKLYQSRPNHSSQPQYRVWHYLEGKYIQTGLVYLPSWLSYFVDFLRVATLTDVTTCSLSSLSNSLQTQHNYPSINKLCCGYSIVKLTTNARRLGVCLYLIATRLQAKWVILLAWEHSARFTSFSPTGEMNRSDEV